MPAWSGPGRLGQHQADAAYDNRLDALAGISVPSLVVGFELDMGTAVSLCREVADAIVGCQYVEIPGVGHGAMFEKPDDINAALLEFFEKA
jgi:pimeloyl-ACP methyl ester carboxylesterase